MINALRQFLRDADKPRAASVPAGRRAYAIGDIHGHRALFAALSAAIDADDAARAPAETTVILLGDLVDRGPDSAGVIDEAMRWAAERDVRLIAGNHEEMFLDALDDLEMLRHFIRIGGRETLLSYGIDPETFRSATIEELCLLARAAVPVAHRRFLEEGTTAVRVGDYLFVHAGIRPDVPLGAQETSDLRWIREPFLSSVADHGVVVVHGHTIVEEPAFCANRIGIDTGAFMSGRLTALCLEGTQRWLIEARYDRGAIRTGTRPA